MKYFIPVLPETLELCEFIQGGPIPHMAGEAFLIVNPDPELKYKVGVCPAETVQSHPPQVILYVV